jgi:hypothetical protein
VAIGTEGDRTMTGTISILNVGEGDVKVSFDKSNPAETIRARRIVKDMLRRGYALLVEIERDGVKAFERALDFDEKTDCYIVADFDPVEASKADEQDGIDDDFRREAAKRREEEKEHGQSEPIQAGVQDVQAEVPKRRGRPKTKSVPASGTRAVGVARSAGG